MLAVTFVLLDKRITLERARRLDPDRDWREFLDGQRAWILQTFLRLRAAGLPVTLADRLPQQGIAVFSSSQRRRLRFRQPRGARNILVGVREDVGAALIADFEIVQNRHQSDDGRCFFVPHWPQPGLLPRDAARGTRITQLVFKGYSGNLHPDFKGESWRRFLAEHGLSWSVDAVPYAKDKVRAGTLAWNDYRTADLMLAVRPPGRGPHPRKPATKLYNAWHAGVPALLGPEIAYRELRRSPLDYIEVDGRPAAEAAILRLRAAPQLYAEMVEHGRRRAQEFTVATITRAWEQVLFEVIPRQAHSAHVRRWQGRSLYTKELVRRARRALK